MNLESKRFEKVYGISILQLLVLQFISEQKDFKATATFIKDYVNLNASTTSGIISRLELKEFVAKVPEKEDKRFNSIMLTAKGATFLNEIPPTLQKKLSSRLQILKADQIEELNRNIDLLIEILGAADIDASPLLMVNEIEEDED
ncbi:MAG: MarR family transcriptional regulator [Saprospiraceae bacterium]